MAFDDLPQIDQSARNSDLSERRFNEIFNLGSGFIPRPDVPDKGCDFDVELVQAHTGATNWRFPVQLKSIEELTFVQDGRYISYSFATSRLGYLIRRKPSMGLIVLYDVENDICYYDFADEIYQRLNLERESEEWKQQETVNIHISVANKLTVQSAEQVHAVFTNRFVNNEKMHLEQGKKYGLPTLQFVTDFSYNFTQPQDIKRFLGEYGMLMLSNYDLGILYEMIASLPNQLIYGNKDLLSIAAITYSEAGLYPDSNLFIEKLKRFTLSESEKHNMQFVRLKNQFALGFIDSKKFTEELKAIPHEQQEDANTIIIALNILRYELNSYSALEENGAVLLQEVEDIFMRIDEIKASPRNKALIKLWNMENLSFVINHIQLEKASEIRIKESLGAIITLEEKRKHVLDTLELEQRITKRINQVNFFADETNDDLLKAHSMALHVNHFTQQMINVLTFSKNIHEMKELVQQINLAGNAAASAYNLFYKQHLYKDAYNSLCGMIEVQQLGVRFFPEQFNSFQSLSELLDLKKQMEDELGFTPFQFVLESLPKDQDEESDTNLTFTAELSDKSIDVLAEYMRESQQLPVHRLVNIKDELLAYRLFNQRCKDSNVLILTFKTPFEQQHLYSTPTRFVLRSKKTNLETLPSSDMEMLLRSIGC